MNMEKVKIVYKKVIVYIASRKILKYSIIAIILMLPISTILTNKYLNSKEINIEKPEQLLNETKDDKKVATGNINTEAFVDKNISRHTLSEGFSTLPDDHTTSLGSNSSNNNDVQQNISQNIDKSSLNGMDLEILEGSEFNPKKDLKLQATDKDGSNISDNIIIEKNTVNPTVPGNYSVKASVSLSNGAIKQKEFTVTVKETRLDVSLETFKPIKTNVEKGESIGFELDLKVSKKHVQPIAVMINGQEYTLYKGNENIIDILTNTKNYKVFINSKDDSGVYEYNLEHVKMSNGSWISLGENTTSVEVLKTEASINNFNYEEQSKDKKVKVKFDLNDLDNTASNLRLEFYKEEKLLQTIKLDKILNYLISLPVNSNGIYNLKILSDISLNQNINEENTILNKEIFSTNINISNIDQTSISGNNIEINQGEIFNFIKDLNLKATDFDGEDITEKIQLDGSNIDTSIEGTQTIKVYVVNKYGEKYEKEFDITVIPNKKSEFSLSRIISRNFTKDKVKSSFAKSSSGTTIIKNDKQTFAHNVEVSGNISRSDGSGQKGKIVVEIPTSMSFTVDEQGNFISASSYTIKNKSSFGISVFVSQFIDNNKSGGITINPIENNNDIYRLDRSNVQLALVGNKDNYIDLANKIDEPIEILTVDSMDSEIIQLLGRCGKSKNDQTDNNGANDNFTIVFKIKKI